MREKPRPSIWVAFCALLLLLFTGAPNVGAQATGAITGTVRSGNTQQPLNAVQIEVKGTTLGGLSGEDGRFLINNVPVGQQTLRATLIGHGRTEVTVSVQPGQATVANFTMAVSAIELGGIVVTGTAGAQQKREIGNSIATISVGEKLETAPIQNVVELLTARTPGLTLMSNSGQVGSSSNIRIRGAGSMSGGYQPVFYIDGIRIESGLVQASSTYQGGSALDFLNPEDIESIEVVKGPAAATLYGAEAANGVIQIMTKKGRRGGGAPQWSASMEVGQNEWVKSISKGRYTTYARCTEAMQTSKSYPGCMVAAGNLPADSISWWAKDANGDATLYHGIPAEDIIPIPDSKQFILRDDPLFRHPAALRTGSSTDFNASVRGGTSSMGYFLSFNKNDEDGVFFNNVSKRMGGRGNFDVQVLEDLNVSTQFSYTRTQLQQPLNNNASNGVLRNAMRGRARGQRAPWEAGFLGFSPWISNQYDNQNSLERMTIGVTGTWHPIEAFTNRLTLGLDRQSYIETYFMRQDTTGKAPWGVIAATGEIDHTIAAVHRWTLDYVGTFNKDINESLTSAFSGGMQLNARKRRSFDVNGEGLVANNLNLVGAAAVRDADESVSEQTSLGFFFEERLGWRERVYATGAVRVDDNSAFGSDFSLVVYPKASLSWVISEEDFFNIPKVDEMKVRVAWGRAGNAPDPFSADRTYTSGQTVVSDAMANTLTISEYGNPNLKAETGQEWEIGTDASLLGGRAGLEFTYYNKKTVDALVSVPDPGSTGYTGTHLVNIGEISNSGIELLLTGTPVVRQNFTWDASLSVSTNHNKLVSFNGARDEQVFGSFADVQRHREGYPLGGFWAVDVERGADGKPIVYDKSGNVIANPVLDAAGQSVKVLSKCRWAPHDATWDQAKECQDIYMGPSRPTREAAFTSTFTVLKDLQIFGQLDYRGGHYQWCAACSLGTRTDLNTWDVNTGGTALNPDVTVADVLAMRSLQTKSHISKADYLKLREVSVTYNVPVHLTRAAGGSRWAITLSARNLAMWTTYKGKGDPEVQFDPRSTFTMLDYASTPQTRRLSASARVSF